MFSYLSRGYGTWEGIAKLEAPDSAISTNRENYVFPPIKEKCHFYDQHFGHDGLYKLPPEKLKLPDVPKSPLHVPKTYTTKRGALLLYSEGCFVPGSRRLKKRPRYKRQKERRLQTLKDLMQLIMDYKKNGCDPLLLEQLWRRMSNSARDVQPGYSPKRYLSHLSQTAIDPDSWKKLAETGSLRTFGATDNSFLPSLLPDYIDELNHRPQPYKTMSLPPVSPSSSMLGSFTFYKTALSTGAASMVSLSSVNSETVDEQLSVRSAGTFVGSLADRLAEVESENGFKRNYDSLNDKEKEDLLTQLLVEVTLHSQGDIITVPAQDMMDSPVVDTDISYLIDDKDSKSVASLLSYQSVDALRNEGSPKTRSPTSAKSSKSFASDKGSSRVSRRTKSSDSTKSVKLVTDRGSPVCPLPPIVSKESARQSDGFKEVEKRVKASLSSSGSGLSLVVDNFAVDLKDIDLDVEHDSFNLEDTGVGLERKDSEARSLRSGKTISEHSLIDALDIQDGEPLHWLTDETLSLRSLGTPDGGIDRAGRVDEGLSSDSVADGDLVKVHGDVAIGDSFPGEDGTGCRRDAGDMHGAGYDTSEDGIVLAFDIGGDRMVLDTDYSGDDERTKQTMPAVDLVTSPKLQTPHMSLSNLQNEVRLVAEEVLSRPMSGRVLAEDAETAAFLLMDRMEGLLAAAITDDARAHSAAPNNVRPLGQPRNSDLEEKRRVRSAGASLASRKDFKYEEKQAEKPASEVKEPHVEVEEGSVSKSEEADVSVDDVIVTVETIGETGTVKETITQFPPVVSATPSPEVAVSTVKDLQPEVQKVEEMKQEVTKGKERKEEAQNEVKVKKGGTTKRGSVAKSKKKKTSVPRAGKEPPKATPFRAGLVRESKPPKGLQQKASEARKKGNDKQISSDLQELPEKAQLETEPEKTDGLSEDVPPPGIPVRVDSETGEIEHEVSSSKSEKSPSSAGSRSPASEDVISVRAQTESSRDISPSVDEKTISPPFDEISSPRHKTSSHGKTPSPHEKPCPRDRDAVPREEVNWDVVKESVELVARESPPEVVQTEKQRRANARAAIRAAAAERRRQEVERKRRERDEARRRAQEEEARLEVLRKEAEEEMIK